MIESSKTSVKNRALLTFAQMWKAFSRREHENKKWIQRAGNLKSWLLSGVKNSEASAKFSGKSVLPPIHGSVFPEIRACMEEQDFHINIIKGKKKVSSFMQIRSLPICNVLQFKFWHKVWLTCNVELFRQCKELAKRDTCAQGHGQQLPNRTWGCDLYLLGHYV